tara:strand:+ start:585 stop:842 length:258 start_codon:yes stop_codon:yes gene_type:complete
MSNYKMKGSSFYGKNVKLGGETVTSPLKQTSFVDKVKSAGKAVWDNLGKEHGHGNTNSLSHNISRSYKKNKKEYRDADRRKKMNK